MRNRLRAVNLIPRCAIPKEVHKEKHIEECLVFDMVNGVQDWKSNFFSVEVTFSITQKEPIFVYRPPGTRFDHRYSAIRARSGRVYCVVLGGGEWTSR